MRRATGTQASWSGVGDRLRERGMRWTPQRRVVIEVLAASHGHGADGREEFHVPPVEAHGHLYCADCGGSWEVGAHRADAIQDVVREHDGFGVDLSHVRMVGRCRACRERLA